MAGIIDPSRIKPIAQKVVNAMYGNEIKDINFRIVEKFTMKPDVWDVAVDFRDGSKEVTVDLEVDGKSGKVTSAREIIKW